MATYTDYSPKFRAGNRTVSGYSLSEDLSAIQNSITNIFLVRLGEVPGKPWFGNGLFDTLFEPIDLFTVKILKEHISNQVLKFDQRVIIDDIVVDSSPQFNRVSVDIKYSVNIDGSIYNDTVVLKDLSSLVTSRNTKTGVTNSGTRTVVSKI